MTDAKTEERNRLAACLDRIDANLAGMGARVAQYQADIQAAHDHMWEHRRDMDHLDKVAMRQSIAFRENLCIQTSTRTGSAFRPMVPPVAKPPEP